LIFNSYAIILRHADFRQLLLPILIQAIFGQRRLPPPLRRRHRHAARMSASAERQYFAAATLHCHYAAFADTPY